MAELLQGTNNGTGIVRACVLICHASKEQARSCTGRSPSQQSFATCAAWAHHREQEKTAERQLPGHDTALPALEPGLQPHVLQRGDALGTPLELLAFYSCKHKEAALFTASCAILVTFGMHKQAVSNFVRMSDSVISHHRDAAKSLTACQLRGLKMPCRVMQGWASE